ncbi:MAG: DEAD/DEAH box helicase, partial [Chthoniobacterales bacterium]|nr:DEAD/DEAH box helicase [Chthoniobacterales bacterium]
VIESAQAFLVAAIAKEVEPTLWVICPSVHRQELLYETLINWLPDALFLPEAEFLAIENILPDQEITAERLALLSRLEGKQRHLIVATRDSLDQPAPPRGALRAAALSLQRGATERLERVVESLGQAGYERAPQVTTRGQFAVRGGILDVYSWQAQLPIRAEFSGDEIESLREFDLDTQTSVGHLPAVEVLLGASDDQSGTVRDYLRKDHLQIAIEPEDEEHGAAIVISEGWFRPGGEEDFSGAFVDCEIGEFDTGEFIIAQAKRQQFFTRLTSWWESGARIAIYFQTEGEIERFREIMADAKIEISGLALIEGTLPRGFCFPAANLVVLAAAELFGRAPTHGRRRLQRATKFGTHRAQIDFSELHEDDLVVHLEHGIGRFLGLTKLGSTEAGVSPAGERPANPSAPAADTAAATPEVLAIEFADEAKLYVPLEQSFLVSRYVGVGKKSPQLSSLADAKWSRARKNAAASIFDYAGKMLALQAERETQTGHLFGPDTKWQLEFEHSFPFRETPDQLKAIADTKQDMEAPRSMDRLICGDVGFGKTEVAIRAAFKAVMEGKQVAVLTPTTVLAQQHFETFRQRMLDYPVRIEMLSRFRSHAEQRKVLEQLRDGSVDVVVGTHRLISGDVVFKDLGLVVIDEEQRFGVLHKEKFKELFKLVDVLTLSATPIPRTLYLSLGGVKDMSTIETPPLNRLPVETIVAGYDER